MGVARIPTHLVQSLPAFVGKMLNSESNTDLPIVSLVVPIFGLTSSILRTLKGNPQKELQWRLLVVHGNLVHGLQSMLQGPQDDHSMLTQFRRLYLALQPTSC